MHMVIHTVSCMSLHACITICSLVLDELWMSRNQLELKTSLCRENNYQAYQCFMTCSTFQSEWQLKEKYGEEKSRNNNIGEHSKANQGGFIFNQDVALFHLFLA